MTQLDEFTIDFKTKAHSQTFAEIASIDKQLDAMEKKGKRRSDDESKQYQELKKRRKELLDETKQQQRETDKLADSFGKMAQNIIGAATGFATLSGLKTGILDAAKLNSTIYLQSKVTGQAENELAAYGAAVQSFGGDAQSFIAQQFEMAKAASQAGISFKNVGDLYDRAHDDLQKVSSQGEKLRILGLYGVTDLATIAFLEQSNEEYSKSVKLHKDLAVATEADRLKAREFESAYSDAATAFTYAFTRIGSDVLPAVTKGLGELNEYIKELEKQQGGLEQFFTKVAAAAGLLVAPLRVISASLLVASEIGASEHDILHPSEGRQSFLAKKIDSWFGLDGQAPSGAAKATTGPYTSMDYLISQGYTPGQAAGILGNARVESGGNPTPAQNAYNRGHFGKYQWDASRRAKILAGLNIDVATASEQDQDRAFVWEARQRGDDARIKSASNEYGSALITNSYFERSGSASINDRMREAHSLLTQYNVARGGGGSSRTANVKIDNVTIHTQATDAAGISRAFVDAFNREYHTAFSALDDAQDR